MKKHFNNIDFDINCPNCNNSIHISAKQVGQNVTCTNCKQTIHLQDDGFTDGINKANKAIDDLLSTLDLFNK